MAKATRKWPEQCYQVCENTALQWALLFLTVCSVTLLKEGSMAMEIHKNEKFIS